MLKFSILLLIPICLILVAAQVKPRIGPDGKPLLNRPIPENCQKRISYLKWGGHHYFLSWREPWNKFEDWDWFNGRNFCRDQCMDLVSFDSPDEYKLFSGIMQQDNVSSIWTSGRKCNFKNKGCDASHLQPINVNGWFWAGASNTRIPSTNQPSDQTFWSVRGESGQAQPDNFEGILNGKIETENDIGITIEGWQEYHDEACLAALNNKYGDGVSWHDVACHFRSVLVCEDSDQLIQLVKSENNVDVTDTVQEAAPERRVNAEAILAAGHPLPVPNLPTPAPPPQPIPQRPRVRQPFEFAGKPQPRPPRRPNSGFFNALGLTRGRFPFLF